MKRTLLLLLFDYFVTNPQHNLVEKHIQCNGKKYQPLPKYKKIGCIIVLFFCIKETIFKLNLDSSQ